MARSILAVLLFGCLLVAGLAQCNPETSTQGEPGAGCEPMMKRTTRKLQEVDTIPGLGAAASGLMQGFNGLGNMGQMFSRVGQFFQNLRPAAGAARTARGGSDGATELTPVREPASAGRATTPRPSRSSDRLESGRPSADRSSGRTDRPSRLERRDRDDDNDSRDDSRGSRRDTVTIPRSDRGRDRDSRSSRRSSSRSDSSRGDSSRSGGRSPRVQQNVVTLAGPNFREVTPLQMAVSQAVAQHQAPQAAAAAHRKIGVVPK